MYKQRAKLAALAQQESENQQAAAAAPNLGSGAPDAPIKTEGGIALASDDDASAAADVASVLLTMIIVAMRSSDLSLSTAARTNITGSCSC